jgi:hypothetical protein
MNKGLYAPIPAQTIRTWADPLLTRGVLLLKSKQIGGAKMTSDENHTNCPTWDAFGQDSDMPPFFSPNEDLKRKGFTVRFLADGPRKETDSPFSDNKELWFDIEYQSRKMTWTISQISLLAELKRQSPLAGNTLHVRLIPVDEEFKKRWPRFRGRDRYQVKPVQDVAVEEEEIVQSNPVQNSV